MVRFNSALHPRGPNGRFTRSYARHMSSLDGRKAAKVRSGFRPKSFSGPEDARTYLTSLYGSRKLREGSAPAGSLSELISSGAFARANDSLRAGKSGPEADALKAQMKPLPDDLQLFRRVPRDKLGGASADPSSLKNLKVSDAGFFPATIAPVRSGPDTVQLTISAPAGTPAVVDPDTGQVVLGNGVEMAVDDVEVGPDGSTRMDLVAFPTEGSGGPDATAPPGGGVSQGTEVGLPPGVAERFTRARTGSDALGAPPTSIAPGADRGMLFDNEREALTAYRGASYAGINHRLRNNVTDTSTTADRLQAGTVGDMDEAFRGSRLDGDIEVHRGIESARQLFGGRLDGDLTGMEWREGAYSSTSADQAVANGFATGRDSVVMRMLVPRGVGAIQLSGDETGVGESEILLERGLTMRVVHDSGGHPRQIVVEVVSVGRR